MRLYKRDFPAATVMSAIRWQTGHVRQHSRADAAGGWWRYCCSASRRTALFGLHLRAVHSRVRLCVLYPCVVRHYVLLLCMWVSVWRHSFINHVESGRIAVWPIDSSAASHVSCKSDAWPVLLRERGQTGARRDNAHFQFNEYCSIARTVYANFPPQPCLSKVVGHSSPPPARSKLSPIACVVE